MESSRYPIKHFSLQAENITKEFNRRPVFRNITFTLTTPASLALTGKNGAGKSTLSKIVAGCMSTTQGSLSYRKNQKLVEREDIKDSIGFVSPYLNFYDEFTAQENLRFLSRIRTAILPDEERLKELLSVVNLWQRRNDQVGTFSSGMKQRLKYAFALLLSPSLLILDEPTNALDPEGIEFARHVIRQQKKQGILVIATSDRKEVEWCDQEIHLGGKD
jgi:heme exporter protein A